MLGLSFGLGRCDTAKPVQEALLVAPGDVVGGDKFNIGESAQRLRWNGESARMHAFYRGRWWSWPEPCVGRRLCQPRDAVPKETVSHRISRWCTGRIQLVDATPRYFGGVRWGRRSSSWRFVAIGVRFPRRDRRRWPGGRTGSGSGRRLLRGDDRECSRRCRRVAAGWFSEVLPCWRRESTTARDGFGVAPVLR